MKIVALIVAGGFSTRFSRTLTNWNSRFKSKKTKIAKKQFFAILNKPILFWTLEVFTRVSCINEIIVVLPAEDYEYWNELILAKFNKVRRTVVGGKYRYDSVYAGLNSIPTDVDLIAIHDAVRPLISESVILRTLRAAKKYGAAVPGIHPVDTVKLGTENRTISQTLPREKIWLIQTPQVFSATLIKRAYASFSGLSKSFYPDDASLLEFQGHKITIVPGDYRNIKITTYTDLKLLKMWLRLT